MSDEFCDRLINICHDSFSFYKRIIYVNISKKYVYILLVFEKYVKGKKKSLREIKFAQRLLYVGSK
ncbi:hypothetical protein HMPREF1992_00277 [Selenomonas sp. oral taxon 892 str. F0426]|nr:hypothetical protein HMPREF1992_00277 [Selenomonas sp. oral taxon 892 str. F0426]